VSDCKPTLLLIGPARPLVVQALASAFQVRLLSEEKDTGTSFSRRSGVAFNPSLFELVHSFPPDAPCASHVIESTPAIK